MSELPTEVSYRTLDEIVYLVETEGLSLQQASESHNLDIMSLAASKTVYWYLFDRLPRDAAQTLWVGAWKANSERLEQSREL